MKIKDVKIGDKVQLRKDIPEEELTELLYRSGLTMDIVDELQRRGEVTVENIQEGIPGKEGDDDWDVITWDSITLVDSNFYWPIELFEPVNIPKVTVKSKEEQVQEDIQNVKDIIKRYNLKDTVAGAADSLVWWLERYGQDNLSDKV